MMTFSLKLPNALVTAIPVVPAVPVKKRNHIDDRDQKRDIKYVLSVKSLDYKEEVIGSEIQRQRFSTLLSFCCVSTQHTAFHVMMI